MTYYKVVKEIGGRLYSLVHTHPPLGVEYKVGEWTKPVLQGSKLFICNDLEDATFWAEKYEGIIYKCEAKQASNKGPYVWAGSAFADTVYSKLSKMLSLKRKHRKYTHLSEYEQKPLDVVLASAVKLVERLG